MVSCVWLQFTHLMVYDGCSWPNCHICIPAVERENREGQLALFPGPNPEIACSIFA